MSEIELWHNTNERAEDNIDIVSVIYKQYFDMNCLVLRDVYGEGNMTITIEDFKEMVGVVLDKLEMLEG